MGPSIWQLLIVLVIVLLLFGTKRLRNLGGDMGSAIKGFKTALKDGGSDNDEKLDAVEEETAEDTIIEGQVTSKDKEKV